MSGGSEPLLLEEIETKGVKRLILPYDYVLQTIKKEVSLWNQLYAQFLPILQP